MTTGHYNIHVGGGTGGGKLGKIQRQQHDKLTQRVLSSGVYVIGSSGKSGSLSISSNIIVISTAFIALSINSADLISFQLLCRSRLDIKQRCI